MTPITSSAPGGRLPGNTTPDMLTIDDALERVVAGFQPLGEHERVPLLDALGRVLVEDIPADLDLPPFDNTAMDGYAVRAADVAAAGPDRPVTLRVLGEIAAGQAPGRAVGPGQAYRILTGAPLPAGADAVVPFEHTDGRGFGGWSGAGEGDVVVAESEVRVFRAVEAGENVRYAGEDHRQGEVLLRAGSVVRPMEVAVLGAAGRPHVWVHRRPRVAVLSTGDEIVPVERTPGPGQIRDANGVALAALVRHYGGECIALGVAADRADDVRRALVEGVDRGADLLVSSGGVSMGDRDVVKSIVQEDGQVAFWSVDLRPGKPLAYGQFRGVPFFGLPGNPVSSVVTFELFARPALLRLAGHRRLFKVELTAVASEPMVNTSGRENLMRGVVERAPGGGAGGAWTVRLTGEQGSNIVSSLARANALVRVAKSRTRVEPGETVPVLMLDWPPLW